MSPWDLTIAQSCGRFRGWALLTGSRLSTSRPGQPSLRLSERNSGNPADVPTLDRCATLTSREVCNKNCEP